jgi:hypothetical protein
MDVAVRCAEYKTIIVSVSHLNPCEAADEPCRRDTNLLHHLPRDEIPYNYSTVIACKQIVGMR